MGKDVPAIVVNRRDRRAYRDKVRTCLDVLARMLREDRFEAGSQHVGLEIEVNLVDKAGCPAMNNSQVLTAIADPAWAPELGQFNVEINVPPAALVGDVFTGLESTVRGFIARAGVRAETTGSRLVMVGILPSAPKWPKCQCRMTIGEGLCRSHPQGRQTDGLAGDANEQI